MTGIPDIQRQRALDSIIHKVYSSGRKPRAIDVMKTISEYFGRNPLGLPIRQDPSYLGNGLKSDVNKFNHMLESTLENTEVLYQSSFDQVQALLTFGTILRTELNRLDSKRRKTIAQIDDYLFSLYNTDGYYYSTSDTFADVSSVDLNLTTAIIDTQLGAATISASGAGIKPVEYSEISSATIKCESQTGTLIPHDAISQFGNAIDGLSNTAWIIELDRSSPDPVICTVTMLFNDPVDISKIVFDPYGITPVQVFIETVSPPPDNAPVDFGNSIQTNANRMLFLDNVRPVNEVKLTLIKRSPDYVLENTGTVVYRYLFGAKEISLSEYFYDSSAVLVSVPLSIDPSLINDQVIDAVSLTTVADILPNTNIKYYVAAHIDDVNAALDDFDWKGISPIESVSQKSNSIVDFQGATIQSKHIVASPSSNDLKLIPFDSTNVDIQKRNPTPSIIDGVDVYRITAFEDEALPKSMFLEEGINTTKIYHIPRNVNAINGLDFWVPYVNGSKSSTITYGAIKTGNEFFYGGDVGQNSRSVYLETYLESLSDQPILIKSFRKSDPNSKQWAIRLYLNGRQLAYMPVGTNEFLVPWVFKEGLNHIAIIIDIPPASSIYPNVYIGTLDLMGDSELYDFGIVKLANWDFVDFFNLQYNQTGEPQVFSLYNNEIVSRRKPTSNFRVKYSKATQTAPYAIRVRADLTRDATNPSISPMLHSYRLRFLYGDN